MWFEGGQTYDLTGAFILNLATFHNDSRWRLYDPATGRINVTDTKAKFEATAVPHVPLACNSFRVEGSLAYVGGSVSRTYLIPRTPVPPSRGTNSIGRSGAGVFLNGGVMDPPAPVAFIKAAFTIAALDDCGGHVDPFEGYRYHAATGCTTKVASTDGHAALIGHALDGYGIFELNDASSAAATGPDTCRGHSDSTRGYHYHVATVGANMFIGCLSGQQGTAS